MQIAGPPAREECEPRGRKIPVCTRESQLGETRLNWARTNRAGLAPVGTPHPRSLSRKGRGRSEKSFVEDRVDCICGPLGTGCVCSASDVAASRGAKQPYANALRLIGLIAKRVSNRC